MLHPPKKAETDQLGDVVHGKVNSRAPKRVEFGGIFLMWLMLDQLPLRLWRMARSAGRRALGTEGIH